MPPLFEPSAGVLGLRRHARSSPCTRRSSSCRSTRTQDPELAAYSGARVTLQRCRACGFAQPAALPALPRYFDRMYDQRWADDWIAGEHDAAYKDRIFADILAALGDRVTGGRALLDVGAHAGRFLRLARAAGLECAKGSS